MNEKIVIISAGRGGQLIAEMLKQQGKKVLGFVDDSKTGEFRGLPVLGKIDDIKKTGADSFVVGIGMDLKARERTFSKAAGAGLNPINVIAKTAVVDKSAEIGRGNIIMANSVIGHFAKMGGNCFVFSNSTIEHNCELGNNVYIAPGVSLAGTVKIGDNTLIGIGASIKEEIKIGKNSIVGAGAVVLDDVPDNTVVVGIPAKKLRDNV